MVSLSGWLGFVSMVHRRAIGIGVSHRPRWRYASRCAIMMQKTVRKDRHDRSRRADLLTSQADFGAIAAGVKQTSVSRWERKTRPINPDLMDNVLDAAEASVVS